MNCPRCKQENPPEAKLCLECATPLAPWPVAFDEIVIMMIRESKVVHNVTALRQVGVLPTGGT